MTISHRARTALTVVALAVGLIGTTLPTSALAAQTASSRIPASPHRPAEAPRPGDPQKNDLPLPDVSVKTFGSNGSNLYPSFLDVEFDLLTTGAAANNVALTPYCTYELQNNKQSPWYPRKEKGLVKQMSLSASWPVPVPFLVTCTPQSGELVATVELTADVPGGDSNPSNNFAYWDHLSGPWK